MRTGHLDVASSSPMIGRGGGKVWRAHRMKRAKIIVAAILAILLIIIVVQNRQPVATKLLFATITMPRAMLLLVSTLIGFALGLIAASYIARRRRR